MEALQQLLNDLLWRSGSWVNGHIGEVALALVATLLVVYGNDINRSFARTMRPYPWVLRVGAFVLLCAFGYGAITVIVMPFFVQALLLIETRWLGLAALGAFLLVGWLAERKNQL